jgi:outer membrane biosynthesis protein TonB
LAVLNAWDWLRERPIALIAAVLGCVLVIAFAPWLWRASFGAYKAEAPAIAPLQPTYVEPPAEAVSAPVPAAAAEPVEAVEEPPAQQPTASKPASKAKPRNVAKRVVEPKRAQAPIAPAPEPEPVAAPAPVDTGGHSGFAPKCRWVTPTNWSCK